jgi:hypothetical protein
MNAYPEIAQNKPAAFCHCEDSVPLSKMQHFTEHSIHKDEKGNYDEKLAILTRLTECKRSKCKCSGHIYYLG